MKLDYHVLDVFTGTRGRGNPLAVVLRAGDLTDGQMQRIAKEFNLSETVFVTSSYAVAHSVRVRIFTPKQELPFAGHPTVGTAVLYGLLDGLKGLRIEENVGRITCVIEKISKEVGHAQFALPKLPQDVGPAAAADAIAATLGIEVSDIGFDGLMPRRFSAGNPFTLVPVRDAKVLARMVPQRRGWSDVYPGDHPGVLAFCPSDEEGFDYSARMFSTDTPGGEDPATGSAAAALIGLLAEADGEADARREYRLRQGREMGRPSEINMSYARKDGALVHAAIGGKAVMVQSGQLDPD